MVSSNIVVLSSTDLVRAHVRVSEVLYGGLVPAEHLAHRPHRACVGEVEEVVLVIVEPDGAAAHLHPRHAVVEPQRGLVLAEDVGVLGGELDDVAAALLARPGGME